MVSLRKIPTIQDVARHAGVSTATVSRALSRPEQVSGPTRERIEDSVAAVGYTLNEAARSLRQQKARTILIALPNVGNPFYSTILDAVVKEAGERGYGVLVANRQSDDSSRWLRDYFLSNRADGLLLFDASLDTDVLEPIMAHRGTLPLVVVCDEILPERFNLVTSDNFEAAGRAVDHLVKLGHRRIGMVTGPQLRDFRNERHAGFCAAMVRHGLPIVYDWVLAGTHLLDGGIAAGERFVALRDRPTAMFCANDETAIGFMLSVQRAGMRCPEDVSVIGFDDIDLTRYLLPGLTTMRQERNELGLRGASALIEIIEGRRRKGAPLRTTLRCPLVERGSTAPPA